jgi:trk system potassium uptake protein
LADRRTPRTRPETIVLVGLGRFGSALAEQLLELGNEVLGIDRSPQLVAAASGQLTYVVEGDATDPELLRQLGVAEVRHAVVAIGDDIQSSILATAALADLGIPDIWAKAVTGQHARILERVGATYVVFPERDMGRRVAHRVAGNVLEYFQVDEGFVLVEQQVPQRFIGRTLAQSGIRAETRLNVVSVQSAGGGFRDAGPDTVLHEGDVLLVAGTTDDVQRYLAKG